MREEELYDTVGEWFVKNKGCQQDEYSQGYLKNVKIGDVRPDVLAMRYEVDRDRSVPVIDFHGFVVEVKSDESGLNDLVGKVFRTKGKVIKQEKPHYKDWSFGFDTLGFYIAYPTEKVSPEIFEMCENDGIGILRLQTTGNGLVNVYEVLKPEKIDEQLQGVSRRKQESPGNFVSWMNSINHLKQMFQRPEKLYEDFIRPGKDEYNKRRR